MSEQLEKALPANLDAERAILGATLLDNSTIDQAMEALATSDFYLDSHRRIYEQMCALTSAARTIDPITLADELRREGRLEEVGGPAYIASLYDGVPRFSQIENYCQIVRANAILRALVAESNATMTEAMDAAEPAEVILDRAERRILSIRDRGDAVMFIGADQVAAEVLSDLEQRQAASESYSGLVTGYHDLDRLTGGIQKGNLIYLAARTGSGKTAMSLSLVRGICESLYNEEPVIGFYSLEMDYQALGRRLLCSLAEVPSDVARQGKLSPDEWRQIALAAEKLGRWKVSFYDRAGLTPAQLRASARRLKRRAGKLDLLVVDYVQLMSAGKYTESRVQEVATASRQLKQIAMELRVPIIAMAQLGRQVETRVDNHPRLSDLRESGSLENDADGVWFLYYEEGMDESGEIVFEIAKHRDGPTGRFKLTFFKAISRFESYAEERR